MVRTEQVRDDGGSSRPERAAQRIAELARGAEPGSRLGTKNELREMCGVSVGSFNEALRLLQARGLVFVRSGPGGGLFVADQSPMVRLGNSMLSLDGGAASVADALRIWDALDPLLTADALWHSSPADIARFRAEVDGMKAAADALDAVECLHATLRLHERIAEVNPSALLRSIYSALLDIVKAHTLAVGPVQDKTLTETLIERWRLHSEIVEAIARRDGDELERLTAAHSVTTSVRVVSEG
jgi:DNA-binding FadR family transcriptional regulator